MATKDKSFSMERNWFGNGSSWMMASNHEKLKKTSSFLTEVSEVQG